MSGAGDITKPKYEQRVHPITQGKDPQLVVFMPSGSSEQEWQQAMGRALEKYVSKPIA